ncbi:hypothetical protein CsatB_029480 [Cannabis sativa]
MADTTLNDLFEESVQVSVETSLVIFIPVRWIPRMSLARRPWLVCGYLLVLMPWPSWLTPEEMAEDAIERSPFTLPLPKLFSEWIVNQKAAKDEKTRQLLKNQRLSLQIECADSRELRTQYPGKRRQVETVVETRVSSGELVINRYPAVTLPGIGEVTPFENTANLIVEKILPDLPPLEVIRTMQKKKDVPSCSGTKIVSVKTGTRHAIPHSPFDHQDAESSGDATGHESIIEAPNLIAVGTQVAKDDNDKLKGAKDVIAQVEQNNTLKSPRKLGSDPKSPFGTQAHIMEYPSKECWDLAFNQLLGAQTVDKFHREPTLFNPILDIEEIRCYESNQGPRKRKATNGFICCPKKMMSQDFNKKMNSVCHQEMKKPWTPHYRVHTVVFHLDQWRRATVNGGEEDRGKILPLCRSQRSQQGKEEDQQRRRC